VWVSQAAVLTTNRPTLEKHARCLLGVRLLTYCDAMDGRVMQMRDDGPKLECAGEMVAAGLCESDV
jgi:hypothetical protein